MKNLGNLEKLKLASKIKDVLVILFFGLCLVSVVFAFYVIIASI
jgi:hypothetical protein